MSMTAYSSTSNLTHTPLIFDLLSSPPENNDNSDIEYEPWHAYGLTTPYCRNEWLPVTALKGAGPKITIDNPRWLKRIIKPEWMIVVEDLCRIGCIDRALREIVLYTESVRVKGNYSELNDIFQSHDLNFDKYVDVALVALLRNTYPYRNSLSAWLIFKNRVEFELISRGRDARRLLRGLK